MAVRLVKGGLQSFDPKEDVKTFVRELRRGRGRGGSGEQARNQRLAEERQKELQRQAEAKRIVEERARQEAQRQEIKRQEDIARQEKIRSESLQKKKEKTQKRIQKIKEKKRVTFRERERLKVLESRQRKIEKKIKKPIITGIVTRVEIPKKTPERLVQRLKLLQGKASTQSIRSEQKDIRNELRLLGFTVANTIIGGTVALVALPKTLVNVAKDPSQLLRVPEALGRSAREFGQLIRVSPTEAFGKISGEIIFLKGSGTTLRVVGKVTGNAATRLNPRFKGITKNKINLRTTDGVTTIMVGGTVKKIAEPLRKQAELAGKRVTAVSAQADRLVTFIKKERIVRKPIPGEAEFSPRIKKLLNKFDNKRINREELLELEGKVSILERSFFADPRGRFRPSRLGAKPKDASLIDLLAGDFTFKATKPQILVFENVKVAKFPKALKDVEKALKSGKTLTESQGRRLLRFQLEKGDKFKPIGALTREPEITLAPGEIIKRVKKAGVTLVNGKKVDIVFAKVIKPTKTTSKLLKKGNQGKLTNKELKQLRKNLKKETGFKPRLSRSTRIKPRARLPRRTPRVTKRARIIPRVSRVPKRPPTRITPRITKRDARGRFVPPPKRATPRPPTRAKPRPRPLARVPPRVPRPRPPIPKPPIVPPRLKTRKIKIKIFKKKQPGFNVIAKPIKTLAGKKSKRGIRINKVPLTKERADDLRQYITDTSLARTSRTVPTKGEAQKPKLNFPRGFAKKTKFKFRNFRIVKGKRVPLIKGKVIERKTRLLDTIQEKRKIGVRKRLAQLVRPKKKRNISASQRKVLIKRLEKARRIKRRLRK